MVRKSSNGSIVFHTGDFCQDVMSLTAVKQERSTGKCSGVLQYSVKMQLDWSGIVSGWASGQKKCDIIWGSPSKMTDRWLSLPGRSEVGLESTWWKAQSNGGTFQVTFKNFFELRL